MRHLRVRWHHDSPDDPVVLYSEIDAEGWEVRKVDEYSCGHRDLASDDIETGTTMLGIVPFPSNEEIAADPQFEVEVISAAEFEEVWRAAKAWFDLP